MAPCSYKTNQVRFVSCRDLTLVEFWNLFCSCPKYEDGDVKFDFEQSNHVQPWFLTRLKPLDHLELNQFMHNEDVEIAYGSGGEEIANEVVVGDNIIVTISTNEGFLIILINTPVHMVKEHFTDE